MGKVNITRATYNNQNRKNKMKRNRIVSLSEGSNIWISAKLINYHYGLLMVTDDGDY